MYFCLIELGCGEQYRPVANPILSHGGQPQTTHSACVVNYNPVGVARPPQIDVSGDTNLQVFSMGTGRSMRPFRAGYCGAIFVANRDSDSVSQFSLIGYDHRHQHLAVSRVPACGPRLPVSTAMYVANSGTNSFCPHTGSMSVISTGSLVATSTVCVGVNPGRSCNCPATSSRPSSNNKVYVANKGDNTISVYNPATAE